MRKYSLVTFCCLMILLAATCAKRQSDFQEGEVKKMLKNFYSAFINHEGISASVAESWERKFFENYTKSHIVLNESDSNKMFADFREVRDRKSDSIKAEYLSNNLYRYLHEVNKDGLVLDFVPFLGGNMIDTRMLEGMSFNKIRNDIYAVRFKYGGDFEIKLRVVREQNKYKIGDTFFEGADGREYELTKDKWH